MSRALRLAVAPIALAIAITFAGVPGAGAAGKGEELPSRLLVTAREYSFTLSRPKVDAGPAILQLYDYGEDAHDLQLQRVGSDRVFSMGVVEPGDTGELRLRLRKRSRYRLWCSLADHAQLGMRARLRTTRH